MATLSADDLCKLPFAYGGDTTMKTGLTALVIISFMSFTALPAAAQMGKRNRQEQPKAEENKPKVDDKAYKAALDRIPDSKVKYDPWGGVVPAAAKGGAPTAAKKSK